MYLKKSLKIKSGKMLIISNLLGIWSSGIFIVDHACGTIHTADTTGALSREFALQLLKFTLA